jgi:hypothetical protein
MKIILTILLTAIVGTTIIHVSEQYFGSANVFIAATSIVFIFGGIVVPITQIKNKR